MKSVLQVSYSKFWVITSEVSISYVIEKKYLKKALEKIQEELA